MTEGQGEQTPGHPFSKGASPTLMSLSHLSHLPNTNLQILFHGGGAVALGLNLRPFLNLDVCHFSVKFFVFGT